MAYCILLNVSLKVDVGKGWLANLCSVPCVVQQEATIYSLHRLKNKQIHVLKTRESIWSLGDWIGKYFYQERCIVLLKWGAKPKTKKVFQIENCINKINTVYKINIGKWREVLRKYSENTSLSLSCAGRTGPWRLRGR